VHAYTPVSVILDAPVVYDDPSRPGDKWKPKNYENKFYGPTTFREALEHSRNVVTVKILSELGLNYTINYARRFGIESQLTPNLSLALGTSGLSLFELTRAYSVFVNQGKLVEPVLIEEVRNREGKVIYQARPQDTQAISPQTAFIMTHLLRGVVQNGTGRKMKALHRPVAGKTGTTNDLRDAWFVGFTPRLVCGVWVGQDDNLPLGRKETGARAAGPIWLEFMKQALKNDPPQDFPVPPGVVFARIDPKSGQAMRAGAAGGFFEAFREGQEPLPPVAGAAPQRPKAAEDFMQAESFAPGQRLPRR
jgi:penicillin-binding protein 1A